MLSQTDTNANDTVNKTLSVTYTHWSHDLVPMQALFCYIFKHGLTGLYFKVLDTMFISVVLIQHILLVFDQYLLPVIYVSCMRSSLF